MKRYETTLFVGLTYIFWGSVHASDAPIAVKAVLAHSAVVVELFSNSLKKLGHGSGVIISPTEVITNCHVLKPGKVYKVHYQTKVHDGQLLYADADRDLCSLRVPSLGGIPAKLGRTSALKEGESVFTVAAPKTLVLVIHGGKVQALRPTSNGSYIRNTAFASNGSSGGGVFISDGTLVGIITFGPTSKDKAGIQSPTFAQPVEWIEGLSKRSIGNALYTTRSKHDYESMINELTGKQQWTELITFSERWLSTKPEYPGPMIAKEAKAHSFFKLGKFAQAIALYQEVVAIEPLASSAWHNMGNVYSGIGNINAAINAFERAAVSEPNPKEASASYFNLALMYNRNEQTESARKAYEQSLRLNPNQPEALRNLGIAWTSLGKPSTGLPFIESAIKLAPNDPQAWLALALAYHMSGDLRKRNGAWKRLEELNPQMSNQLGKVLKAKLN